MTDLDLDHLEELERKATPGEWRVKRDQCYVYGIVAPTADIYQQTVLDRGYSDEPVVDVSLEDIDLIVALRNAAPALFARVRELEKEVSISEEVAETYKQVYFEDDRDFNAERLRRITAEIERDEWKQKYETLLQQRYATVYGVGEP